MSNIKKYAVEQTAVLHLRDGNDELMYADGPEGTPDENLPMQIELYSPGSKTYAKASAAQNNRLIDRMKAKGKTRTTAEEQADERATFLAEVTKSFRNIEYDQLTDEHLFKAVYADREIGFIADQAQAFLGEWGNFTKASPKG